MNLIDAAANTYHIKILMKYLDKAELKQCLSWYLWVVPNNYPDYHNTNQKERQFKKEIM